MGKRERIELSKLDYEKLLVKFPSKKDVVEELIKKKKEKYSVSKRDLYESQERLEPDFDGIKDYIFKIDFKETENTNHENSIALSKRASISGLDSSDQVSEEVLEMGEQVAIVNEWKEVNAAVVGGAHLKCNPPVPCQDAAFAISKPRPAIFVADGAGSSILSHIGSEAVVNSLCRFMLSIEDINQELLDRDNLISSKEGQKYAFRFVKHAFGVLQDLSIRHKHPTNAFQCTLLITIVGKSRMFWLKIGDGAIMIEHDRDSKLELLGPLGKGEFANQTTFVSEKLTDDNVHFGYLPSGDITAVIACTDGACERFVTNDGTEIAGSLNRMINDVRIDKLNYPKLYEFLTDSNIWKNTTGDDKGIAILSRLI